MKKAALAVLLLAGGAAADEVVCGVPGTGTCDTFDEAVFTSAGLNFPDVTEITSNQVAFPGPPGVADLTFTMVADAGAFNFCFGFCLAGAITPSVLAAVSTPGATDAERRAFAEECLSGVGTAIFDDLEITGPEDPDATTTISGVPVPSEVIFFLLPDNKAADFMAAPENFFPAEGASTSVEPSPLFSLNDANPGSRDQLVLFTDTESTLFGWEDKQRVAGSPEGSSDNDFNDLLFRASFVLTPDVPSRCETVCRTDQVVYDFDTPASHTGTSHTFTSSSNCGCIEYTDE